MAMSPEERRQKACERARKWWLLNKERAAENKRQWRMRRRLGLQEKRKRVSAEQRQQQACERARKWHALNKARAHEAKRQRRLLHPQESRERKKQSYLRHRDGTLKRRKETYPAQRETVKEKSKEYYRIHKHLRQTEEKRNKACASTKKWAQRHAEEIRERRRANPEKAQARVRKRRATQMGAEGSFTAKDIDRIYSLQGGKCAGCGVKFKTTGTHRYHIDHIVPLRPANGGIPGSNNPENLQLLCRPCNCQKGNRSPEEWKRHRAI
jgi:5-methylcytosine-specific restriction endonuclease McrA